MALTWMLGAKYPLQFLENTVSSRARPCRVLIKRVKFSKAKFSQKLSTKSLVKIKINKKI